MLIDFDYLFLNYGIRSLPGVLHVGANTGQEAEAYRKHGVKRVIWIEALSAIYIKLLKHLEAFPNQSAICACVSDKDGERVVFNIASNEGQSSSFLEFGTHSKEHPTVKYVGKEIMRTTRLDTLLKEFKIGPDWFLNMDLQGAELLALKGMGQLLNQFKYVYIEVNEKELYKGCALVPEIDAYLADFGFMGMECKMTGSGWGDKFYKATNRTIETIQS